MLLLARLKGKSKIEIGSLEWSFLDNFIKLVNGSSFLDVFERGLDVEGDMASILDEIRERRNKLMHARLFESLTINLITEEITSRGEEVELIKKDELRSFARKVVEFVERLSKDLLRNSNH